MSRSYPIRFAALSLILAGLLACGPEPRKRMEVGSPMPAFRLPSLDGTPVDSETLLGQPLVLNFWATWCQPCLKEIPDLQRLAQETGVRVVGIALDEQGERAVKPFVEKSGLDYTILLGNQEVFERFDGLAIPYTLVINTQGEVVRMIRGRASPTALRASLEPLMVVE